MACSIKHIYSMHLFCLAHNSVISFFFAFASYMFLKFYCTSWILLVYFFLGVVPYLCFKFDSSSSLFENIIILYSVYSDLVGIKKILIHAAIVNAPFCLLSVLNLILFMHFLNCKQFFSIWEFSYYLFHFIYL